MVSVHSLHFSLLAASKTEETDVSISKELSSSRVAHPGEVTLAACLCHLSCSGYGEDPWKGALPFGFQLVCMRSLSPSFNEHMISTQTLVAPSGPEAGRTLLHTAGECVVLGPD